MGFTSTITFKAVGNKTELSMRMVLITAEMKKRAVEEFRAVDGGNQTLSRLEARVTGQFTIFRLVDAPRERVWRAWTDPKELPAWMGPKGSKTTHADVDFRVGGSYHYALEFAGVEMWGLATYREIERPSKLVYLLQFSDKYRGLATHPLAPGWPKRMLNTVHLQDFGSRTLISLYTQALGASEAELETFRDGMAGMSAGWSGTFERLDAVLKEG